jgi:hypothetical protein
VRASLSRPHPAPSTRSLCTYSIHARARGCGDRDTADPCHSAENPTTSPPSSTNITFYDLDCTNNTQICQALGSRSALNAPFSTSTAFTDNTFTGCQTLCDNTFPCQAFSIEIETGGTCSLYVEPLVEDIILDASSLQVLFDLGCPAPVVSVSTSRS